MQRGSHEMFEKAAAELNLEDEKLAPEVLDKLIIVRTDFEGAIRDVMPSAMREVYLEPPDVSWEDIGGLDEVKRQLQEAVEWPMRYPKSVQGAGTYDSKRNPVAWTFRNW